MKPQLEQPVRVVGIDDETAHRKNLLTLTGDDLLAVGTFATVEEFLASDIKADVVLLDLWIRIGDAPLRGLAAVRLLHNRGYRILLHSMDDRPAVLARLLGAGANGFVNKAEPDDVLVDAILRVNKGETVLTTKLAGLADRLRELGFLKLTANEEAVLRARARGLTVKAIALSTYRSEPAIERNITSLNRKVKLLMEHFAVEGLSVDDRRPDVHLLAKALGYGPGDLLTGDPMLD